MNNIEYGTEDPQLSVTRWVVEIQWIVSDVLIEVQIVFISDGISLQGLSVLTRFFVGVGIFPICAKSIARTSAPGRPRFPKNFPRSTFLGARGRRP